MITKNDRLIVSIDSLWRQAGGSIGVKIRVVLFVLDDR